MKNNKGFTLIELVVVIVVLGILSVTAAPKFLDIQSDARIATLQGAKGAVKAANGIVFAKSIIEGVQSTSGLVGDVDTIGGNIVMTEDNLVKAIDTDMNVLNSEFGKSNGLTSVIISTRDEKDGIEVAKSLCYVMFTNEKTTGTIEVHENFKGC